MKIWGELKKRVIQLTVIVAILSCEKEISINLNSIEPLIVIEGNITDTPGPYYVEISRTVNFGSENSFPAVTNALVIISDNRGLKDTLTEMSQGVYKTNKITGVAENSYYLTVNVEGKSFYAISSMPKKVSLDSLAFAPLIFNSTKELYYTVPLYTDPLQLGNYYRFYLFVNGEKENSYSVFNDNLNNGLVNGRPLFSRDPGIEKGDTVSVEMHCIDKNVYNYFYALTQLSSGRPGGVTPSNPTSNITGDYALGYFSAHTIQRVTQIVK
ncbi:MAG: DUF4249 domain-containing protein [Bacteroidetes bacterium HGW-Bacteroidetes-8]|jgi:hypothetical protein|nr:MAG: DUF4249 domain-containing protein [Bacteroidetes bacterium HGW-Bacteroidetes-8]